MCLSKKKQNEKLGLGPYPWIIQGEGGGEKGIFPFPCQEYFDWGQGGIRKVVGEGARR